MKDILKLNNCKSKAYTLPPMRESDEDKEIRRIRMEASDIATKIIADAIDKFSY